MLLTPLCPPVSTGGQMPHIDPPLLTSEHWGADAPYCPSLIESLLNSTQSSPYLKAHFSSNDNTCTSLIESLLISTQSPPYLKAHFSSNDNTCTSLIESLLISTQSPPYLKAHFSSIVRTKCSHQVLLLGHLSLGDIGEDSVCLQYFIQVLLPITSRDHVN